MRCASTRADPDEGRDARRDQRGVRRHRLREDRRGAADDRGVRRARSRSAKAIASYLTKFAYANAAGEDFWTEIARVTGRPVDRIMRSFVDQAGAPVLSIRNACVAEASEIAVAQSRFAGRADAVAGPADLDAPACFKTSDGQPRCEVIDRPAQTSKAHGCDSVFANADARGYYFSEYTPDAVRALAQSAGGLTRGRAPQPARRRVVDGASAAATTSTSSSISPPPGRRRHAGDHSRRSRTGLGYDRRQHRRLRRAARSFQRWIRERFGPALTALGPAGQPATTATTCRTGARRC